MASSSSTTTATTISGFPRLTAEEAAELVQHGDTVGFSGFTAAGTPKAIPLAVGLRAEAEHAAGRPFQIGVLTGASTSDYLDGALARAQAISFRTPYQSDPTLRALINAGETRFFDMHLSMLPQVVRYGFLGPVHCAVVEAADVTPDGEIVLTSGIGCAPTYCSKAKRVLIELNRAHPDGLRGMHDIYEPADPPYRGAIPIYHASDRIGLPVIKVDPSKIAGVVETNIVDEGATFSEPSATTRRIGELVAEFLATEMRAGRIPREFLPLQSGVGDTANAVLGALGEHPDIPPFEMYTEVLQDGPLRLIQKGRLKFASTSSLTTSKGMMKEFYDNLDAFRGRVLMRPVELTNHPEVIRRLGLISINTAIEVDVSGNVNSTHVLGRQLMNGIGGSGDFTRNAYVSIFVCPSMAKGGKISTIVPMVSHVDHSEHSVQVVVTENGVADLRGKDPRERAKILVEKCAHEDYRDELSGYFDSVRDGHSPFTLAAAYAMHQRFLRTGSMKGVDWPGLVHKG
jgi:succinate CoA transferase